MRPEAATLTLRAHPFLHYLSRYIQFTGNYLPLLCHLLMISPFLFFSSPFLAVSHSVDVFSTLILSTKLTQAHLIL